MGSPVSDAACQIGSYTGSLNGLHSTAGLGRMNTDTIPGRSATRRISAATRSTSPP